MVSSLKWLISNRQSILVLPISISFKIFIAEKLLSSFNFRKLIVTSLKAGLELELNNLRLHFHRRLSTQLHGLGIVFGQSLPHKQLVYTRLNLGRSIVRGIPCAIIYYYICCQRHDDKQ